MGRGLLLGCGVAVSSTTVAVEFRNVFMKYKPKHANGDGDTHQAGLHGVTAKVKAGDSVTIVGPSGSGKSTLLSLCNLMLTAGEGEVLVFGKNVCDWDIPVLRKEVGMVYQSPTILPGTVRDNLMLGPKLRGNGADFKTEWLEELGLTESLLNHPADDLSGGQKQRVCLLRTVINQPKILLLDEVTSALDTKSTDLVERFIQSAKERLGCTVLWVTHNLEQAKRAGDETWLLVDGRLVEASATDDFFLHPKTEAAQQFLDSKGEAGEIQ